MKVWFVPVSCFVVTLACLGMARAENLPLPPVPPTHPPLQDRAPVPDLAATEPAEPTSSDTSVDVRLYRANTYDPSMGFAPGSRYKTNEDRKPIQTPGLSFTVPLK